MINQSQILKLLKLRKACTKANKHAEELKAERNELEAILIAAVEAKARVSSRFDLSVEKFPKTYCPPYKTCAIELSSEQAVTEWVIDHDPEEIGKKLVVEVRAPKSRAA